jgi:hypothetical protein
MRKDGKTDDSAAASKPAAYAPQHTPVAEYMNTRATDISFKTTANTTLLTFQNDAHTPAHPGGKTSAHTHTSKLAARAPEHAPVAR